MKIIDTKDAVGHILCHDITQIIPGQTKGPVFRKGHVVREEDIPVLLSVGKEHLYVWENDDTVLHENDAARILEELAKGAGLASTDPKEGKIDLIAENDGLFKLDRSCLRALNSLGEIVIATRHGDTAVKAGDKVAGMRVVPLLIKKEKMEKARHICQDRGPICSVIPFSGMKAGIVTTGSEVYHGRITDKFTPVVMKKLEEYNIEPMGHVVCDDQPEMVTDAIREWIKKGAQMVVCTGGMSVDPDDRTPLSIRTACDEVVTYGAPVLPGSMFMLAYKGDVPVMGLPGCVMYSKRTIFDIVLPRLAAGEKLSIDDFTCLGEGGLCLNCPVCTYPNCGFGKGGSI